MRQLIFIFIAIFLTSFGKVQDDCTREVVFETKEHDFGVIDKGSRAEFSFSFTNKSQVPFVIKNVSASCGCVAAAWSKGPVNKSVSGKITVKYNTNIIGIFRKTFSVHTNLDEKPIILTIKGEVRKKNRKDR